MSIMVFVSADHFPMSFTFDLACAGVDCKLYSQLYSKIPLDELTNEDLSRYQF